MSFLKVQNVSKTYESGSQFYIKKINAVKNISFEMEKGECLGIVGESGSGKSTLGRLIVGLEPCSKGNVLFEDVPVRTKRMSTEKRQALQMVYQNSFEATNPRFSAAEILEEPLKYFHHLSGDKLRKKEIELLNEVGIPACEINKKASSFSGGQLQRICIARAIAAQPKLILLDEPLSSLDVSVQAQILNLLSDLKKEHNLTYLLISHDLQVVYYLTDRLIVMYYGSVVEQIDSMELFESLTHPYSLSLLQAATFQPGYDKPEAGVAHSIPEKGCAYAPRCKNACKKCFSEIPELKNIDKKHRVACHFINGSILNK